MGWEWLGGATSVHAAMRYDEVRNLPGVRDALQLTGKEGVNEGADFDCRITERGSSAMEL